MIKQLLVFSLAVMATVAVVAQEMRAPVVFTDAPGNVFFQGDQPVLQATGMASDLKYALLDWHEKVLQQGDWLTANATSLTFPALPNGYYIVRLTNEDGDVVAAFNFTIIPPPASRKRPANPFFGIDSAQSWLAQRSNFQCRWYDGDTFRLVSDLIAWTGIPNVRERLAWSVVHPSPEEFQYGLYQENARLLHDRNILISGMFHDAPAWLDTPNGIPLNLAGVFRGCRQLAQDFGEAMGDWEFWNEEDIGFTSVPVWDYTAVLKAASLGFRAGNPAIIVAPGATCAGVNTAYHQTMYLNDAAKYTDVMNYHTYAPPADYAHLASELRKFLSNNGIPNRAIWITECGTQQEGHSTKDGVMPGFKAHSPQQEMLHAEFYPKSQLNHMMQGIARNFFFVFPPYNEANGLKDWGVMRRDGSVKPAYAAMSTMLDQLADARLLGEFKLRDSLRAFLLEHPDHSQTLVFWQLSAVDSHADPATPEEILLDVPNGTYTLTDMLGTPTSLQVTDGKARLTATRYPAYLSGLRGLSPTVEALPAGVIDKHLDQIEDEDLTIIFRGELDAEDFTVTDQKSTAEMARTEGRMKVIIWNLSELPKTGNVIVVGGEFEGLPEEVTLPPMGKAEFEGIFRPAFPKGESTGHIVLSGRFDGKTTSKLDIPVKNLALFLENCKSLPMDWLTPQAWERNTSATGYQCAVDKAEKALRFEAIWDSPVDRWFYPVHQLKDGEPARNLQGIQFEVKTTQNKVENDVKCAYVMVGYDTPADPQVHVINFEYGAPLTTWEVRRVMFDQSLPPDATIRFIRIGCNPCGTQLTYWIRNIQLFAVE
ncbi:MAG: hypothetical protein J5654_01260 [Victivallales bacterium]|nr:hypothetical protein [Victivallales bacterium]